MDGVLCRCLFVTFPDPLSQRRSQVRAGLRTAVCKRAMLLPRVMGPLLFVRLKSWSGRMQLSEVNKDIVISEEPF